ncbi:SusC/RagA family TonB-linked outer membrane protein [Mucilaginibacter mali]|uniref:SusC/RagA family TonB-linked outer membrane protein n=1 Tax=Mucilaginibacter mali TaxID=2740462 RepID=A0A7D4Q483_9SPHI|nr:SusC/RagA family TonB-linked outer membrane protein [Mucilaginibacter mali]QKJ32806.1 SusC/RagA family TonB-linked outer membrane protein [Mucilaginibacter mali]
MIFYKTSKNRCKDRFYTKILLILTLVITLLFEVRADSYAQITLNEKAASLESILLKIRKQSGYDFFYSNDMMKNAKPVTISVSNASVEEVLKICFKGQPLTYTIKDKAISLKYLPQQTTQQNNEAVLITGKVYDETNKPMPGASVRVKGNNTLLAITDANGNFRINADPDNDILVVTFIGYKPLEYKIGGKKMPLSITMEMAQTMLKDMVITGMFERKKESFTGASATYTAEQLKAVGNQNVIQSLRTLDPSFIQIENNALGSNPNVLPTIELRGQTSISTTTLKDQFSTDPNQPLFILDGFETSLRNIVDLDMNTVASISILKDAASTAIYGSRAANGVIVIETKKPVPGKIRLSYTSDMKMEMPDLSSYNMMDASEKLQFEKLAGRYKEFNGNVIRQLQLDDVYNTRLKSVLKGVDTYWLSQPLQTGFSHKHSVNASGGDSLLRYDIGGSIRKNNAAMIGEKRDDWGANIGLTYRSGIFNFGNRTYISGSSSAESPYGSYATWVQTNPYYQLLPASEKYLEVAISPTVYASDLDGSYNELIPNPLYNASLASFNRTGYFNLTNNLQAIADLSRSLRIQFNAQISKTTSETKVFVSPLNTAYDAITDPTLRGSYTYSGTNAVGYNVNFNVAYTNTFAQKHILTGNLRAEAEQNNQSLNGYKAVGFPNASNGNPAFAYGFATGSTPNAANALTRRNSLVASVNYSYDYRYNVDLSGSMDGSTAFGSNKRYKPYYAAGVSWNVNKEQFMKAMKWLNLLKLRGNIGINGNQNFGNVSQSVYSYYSTINSIGQGVYLSALGAPDLQWQTTQQISLGLDAKMFNNRLTIQLNGYRKYTDPLVVAITLPSSTGLSDYPFNAGVSTTKGMEATINFSPIYHPGTVVWTLGLTASSLTQKYANFDNKLSSLNTELRASNSLTRYRDGYSSYDLWAVPSLGIDPATGQEVFLKKNGQYTFDYSTDDQVVVGSSRPRAEGVISTTLNYKGFNFGAFVRYIWHRDQFNTALYNKVENISYQSLRYNQDKRALYDRWKNPGDVSQFKSIAVSATTPISSRFIQTENSFSGESINIGYEFRNRAWLSKCGLSALNLNAYSNDLFYASTIKRERGIDYPYTRSVSMSVRLTFK